MHILAALTEGSATPSLVPKTKADASDADFQAAFMATDDASLISADSTLPETLPLETESDSSDTIIAEVPKDDETPAGVEAATTEKLETDQAKQSQTEANDAAVFDTEQPVAERGDIQAEAALQPVLLASHAKPVEPTGAMFLGMPTKSEMQTVVPTVTRSTPQSEPPVLDTLSQHVTAVTAGKSVVAAGVQLATDVVKTADTAPLLTAPGVAEQVIAAKKVEPLPNVLPKASPAPSVQIAMGPLAAPAFQSPEVQRQPTMTTFPKSREAELIPTPQAETPKLQTAAFVPVVGAPQSPVVPQPILARPSTLAVDPLAELKAVDAPEVLLPLGTSGSAIAPQTTSQPLPTALHHPQMPQHIARQMTDALQQGADGPVEVALSPEELGKVRMRISLQEGGVVINILAERAETLELLRRNADQLDQEFRDLGFGSVEFGFGSSEDEMPDEGASQAEDEVTGMEKGSEPSTHAQTETTVAQPHMTQGVDIRL